MQAALTPTYGPADVIELGRVSAPTLRANQVLIQVQASPVTAGDRRLRAADFPAVTAPIGRLMFGVTRPREPVQGTMFAGRIVEVGEAVTRWSVGDPVFGSADHGAWAELLALPEDAAIVRRPEGLDAVEAACLPYGAGTALHFLRELGELQAGERVLILGAAGGVGRFAVQLARHLGAQVTAVCSGGDAELARSLGAHEVIDYRQQDFAALGQRWDLVLDTADASSFPHSRPALTDGGRYLTLYMSPGVLFWSAWTALVGGPRARSGVALDVDLAEVARLAQEGALRPVIARRLPLEDIVNAHLEAERGAKGEVVVEPAAEAALRSVG